MELNEIKQLLASLNQDQVQFDPHFYKRSGERPIDEGMVRSFLSKLEKLEKVEYGKEDSSRFKLWFKMSSKYSLVVIIEVTNTKILRAYLKIKCQIF